MLRPIHNRDLYVPAASLCAPTRTERLAAQGRNASCGVRALPMTRASREAGAHERRPIRSSHPSSLFTLYVGGSSGSPHHTERGSSLLTAKVFQAFRASVCSVGSGSNIPTQGSPLRTVHRLNTVRVIRHEGSLPFYGPPDSVVGNLVRTTMQMYAAGIHGGSALRAVWIARTHSKWGTAQSEPLSGNCPPVRQSEASDRINMRHAPSTCESRRGGGRGPDRQRHGSALI